MKNKIIIAFLLISILFITFFWVKKSSDVVDAKASDEIEEIEVDEKKENKKSNVNKVVVDIKGAVKKPGVYEVESNKRVIDVIKLAGGLNSSANTNYINLSSKVSDEMVIWIYTKSEIEKLKLEQSSTNYMISECNCPVVDNTTCLNSNENKNDNKKEENTIVNINTATSEELMNLSGIGESKAKSIIEYRNTNGKFNKKEDIINVTGIGEALYNKIKDNIKV